MSLFADYILEREGFSTIERAEGLATYKIQGEECYIKDIYIRPEDRSGKVSFQIADQIAEIAKENGCSYLTGTIVPSLPGASISMAAQLKYGFKIHSSHEDYIILRKDI